MSRNYDTSTKRQPLDTSVPFTPVSHTSGPDHLLMLPPQFWSHFSHFFFVWCQDGHLCKHTREMMHYLLSLTKRQKVSQSERKHTKKHAFSGDPKTWFWPKTNTEGISRMRLAFHVDLDLRIYTKVLCPQEAHVSQQVITQQWDMKDTWQDMKDTCERQPLPATPTKMIVRLSPLQIN